jgi:GTP-binding protein HflX
MQRDAVLETLEELDAQDKLCLTVFNKIDLVHGKMDVEALLREWPNSVAISAKTGEGMQNFLEALRKMVQQYLGYVKALVPYSQNALVGSAYEFGRVLHVDYREDGILIEAEVVPEMRKKFAAYQLS